MTPKAPSKESLEDALREGTKDVRARWLKMQTRKETGIPTELDIECGRIQVAWRKLKRKLKQGIKRLGVW